MSQSANRIELLNKNEHTSPSSFSSGHSTSAASQPLVGRLARPSCWACLVASAEEEAAAAAAATRGNLHSR